MSANGFLAIGENIHTTRVVLRKGRRVAEADGVEVVLYASPEGERLGLPIPEAAKATQDYAEGRVKHVKIAVEAAMSDDAVGMDYLRQLVRQQEQAGAAFLDLNVDEISVKLPEQKAAMAWLVEAVQAMTDLPVAVDSSNLEVIETGLEACDKGRARPLLNSASLERLEALDLALAHGAAVVVTAAGEKGMPEGTEARLANASRMVDAALAKGLALAHIYVDPLIFPISVDQAYGNHSLDAIRRIRAAYGPEIHITGGMSNVSFGIPGRKVINDVFLLLAIEAGADSGIIDPVMTPPAAVLAMDRTTETYRLAEDVLLGRDEFCANYIAAWRKGLLEGAPPPRRRKAR